MDPMLWVLVGVNAYLVYYYYQQPQVFTTIIWLYWAQSVLLGLFNFVDILTVGKVEKHPVIVNGEETGKDVSLKTPGAFFFLFHYGMFHVVYSIFLFGMDRTGPFQWELFKYFLLVFFVGQVINFVQQKRQQKYQKASLVRMFFTPYLRVVPMHMTILLPAFYHVSNIGIFLVLKAVADVVMYIVTRPSGNGPLVDRTLVSTRGDI